MYHQNKNFLTLKNKIFKAASVAKNDQTDRHKMQKLKTDQTLVGSWIRKEMSEQKLRSRTMFPQTESINNEAKDYWIATKQFNQYKTG